MLREQVVREGSTLAHTGIAFWIVYELLILLGRLNDAIACRLWRIQGILKDIVVLSLSPSYFACFFTLPYILLRLKSAAIRNFVGTFFFSADAALTCCPRSDRLNFFYCYVNHWTCVVLWAVCTISVERQIDAGRFSLPTPMQSARVASWNLQSHTAHSERCRRSDQLICWVWRILLHHAVKTLRRCEPSALSEWEESKNILSLVRTL